MPPDHPPTHLLYLHGFRSSPKSFKAQAMARWMAHHRPDVHWSCPQLPPSPAAALDLILGLTADWPGAASAVIGSSLGGFYATVLAERRGWPAVVLNPAIDPARDLSRHIGEHTAWHDPTLRFTFRAEHVAELEAMRPGHLTRMTRYGGVIALGDELLDGREMAARYAGSGVEVVAGGDHALSDFETRHLGPVLRWLGLLGPSPSPRRAGQRGGWPPPSSAS